MYKSLLDMYLGLFQAKGEEVLIAICNCKIPSEVVLSAYKKLKPIEEMNDRDKKEMKAFVNLTFPNKTMYERLDACKIIYTIGSLI